ncbi:helix-turn-helix domain-containing protein [Lactobacillus gasseri]|jgi:transcriptional regulator with XRE-family HTH domain|uniref:Transcriptional regulator n=1 Tax=Lactobacillus gasseri TaxID=1596 RepID=A0AB33C4K5_LACGS|nr:helix-turn-helix domain-containing protein [Lactobacillus gasseri]ART99220.1 transcriptional regulator [Lactobacillus gasseri]
MTTKNGYTIFSRIQEIADKRGMSIRQVALKSGFNSPNAIYRYKQGVSPRKTTLNAIADALNTTPEYLLGETDDWQKHDVTPEQELGLDKDDEEMLALFRKSTEGMTEDEKEKFKRSFVKLLKVAKDLNS